MNEEQLERIRCITEAALLAAGKPLSLDQLRELFGEGERPPRQVIEHVLVLLEQSCEGRGFELKKVASGYRLQVREEFAPWVGRLFEEKPQRYSRALLETLALIAYRQPITRGEIEEIRGVTVSSNIIRTLLEREWVRVVGHRDVPGRPAMYATTRQFLDYFNLTGLDELPPLSEVRDLEEIGREIERNMQGGIELDAPDQTLH
jgi:segregation and condensation protein B